MENHNTLSMVLRKTAQEKQLSLREFAGILGVGHVHISKLMAGIDPSSNKPISPTIDTLLKIADALEIPRAEFLRQCGYIDF